MRIDELIANLAAETFLFVSMGEEPLEAFKQASINSLADQVRKDVTGIPDGVVDGVEYAAKRYLGAKRMLESSAIVTPVMPIAQTDINEAKGKLTNPTIGITKPELDADLIAMEQGVRVAGDKLNRLKDTVLKR